MAAAVMFGAVACSQYDEQEVVEGQEVTTTFSIGLEDLGTRLAGDSGMIDKVAWGIYDHQADGKGRFLLAHSSAGQGNAPADFDGEKAEIKVTLFTGKKYDLVFFGYCSANNAYTIDWEKRELNVNYSDLANLEARDAFFHIENEFVAGKNKTFTLTRPFAQLNVGQSMEDYDAMQLTNNYIEKSSVTAKAYTTMNLIDASVSNLVDVELTVNNVLNEDLEVNSVGYKHIAMNYLLVNAKEVVNEVAFKFVENGPTYTEFERTYYNVPLQRNYRTNILGRIISDEFDFEIVIDSRFAEPDKNYVTTIEDLQAVINSAQAGTAEEHKVTKVVLGADMQGEVFVHQKHYTDIIIDGNDQKFKFDGTIKIHTGSSYNSGQLLIRNVAFETDRVLLDSKGNPYFNFVMPNDFGVENGVTRRYSNNVTVENCTFTATGAAQNIAVGVQAKSVNGYLKVVDCTANNLHSLIQAQSCGADVTVKGATINGKNGVAFKQVRNAIVEGCTINTAAYGIRFDGNIDDYSLTVKDNNVTAVQPLIVRKMTGKNNTITLEGTNVLDTTEAFQIVITNGSDDEAYSYPTGTYTLTGHDGFNTYPIDTPEALEAAVKNPALSTVDVQGENITINDGYALEVTRDVVLNMNDVTVNSGSAANYGFIARGDINVVVNDADFDSAGGGVGVVNGAKVNFTGDVYVSTASTSGRYIFYLEGAGSELTINDGNYSWSTSDNQKRAYVYASAGTTVRIKGGNFGKASTRSGYTAGIMGEGTVIITGGTFGFNPSTWVETGYKAVKVDNKWHVVTENTDFVNDSASLVSAIENAADGDIIVLTKDVDYGTVTAGELKNVTINGAEGAVMIFKTDANSKLENVTLNGVNFEYTGATADCGIVLDANAQIDNLVIDGCTVVGTGAKAGRGLSGYNNNATIVIKNTTFKDLGYPIYAWGGYEALTIENCTFDNIKSWAVMPQSGFDGDLTVSGCNFVNCLGGGLVKAGTLTAGHTFTFTDNTITGCTIAGDHNWFQFNVSAGTAVISGNIKDGAAWTPGVADGLK